MHFGAATNYPAVKNFLPTTLDNVSTVGAVNNGFMDMFHGTVTANDDGSYALYTTKVDEAGRDSSCTGEACSGIYFVAFDLFFKVDADSDVLLVGTSSVTFVSSVAIIFTSFSFFFNLLYYYYQIIKLI